MRAALFLDRHFAAASRRARGGAAGASGAERVAAAARRRVDIERRLRRLKRGGKLLAPPWAGTRIKIDLDAACAAVAAHAEPVADADAPAGAPAGAPADGARGDWAFVPEGEPPASPRADERASRRENRPRRVLEI